ncbi:MAG TPA: creatininase family protein [Thermoplasmata archaeon]|nr:creatininase family protein [Thermoplasmata archaeon]
MAGDRVDGGAIDSRSFEGRLATNPVVILPVGALEAHGPHLPLAADEIQAVATATALAERIHGLVLPPIAYGSCPGARDFPGTVSVPLHVLAEYARCVLEELGRAGVRRLLVLSGHAERGHMAALREAADRAMQARPALTVVVLSDYDFVYELRGREAPATDGHAGQLETSRLLHLAADRVGTARPVGVRGGSAFRPGPPSPAEWPESVQGDTRAASSELGARVQAHVLDRLEATVRELWPA